MTITVALLLAMQADMSVGRIGWLSGAWQERKADGSWTEEYWTPPRGGMMIGAGLNGAGEKLRHFEQMRIETGPNGTVEFVAMPRGGAPVRFRLVRQSSDEIVFENAAHDYPQRVSYRRSGDTIIGMISLIDGTRETKWIYRRP